MSGHSQLVRSNLTKIAEVANHGYLPIFRYGMHGFIERFYGMIFSIFNMSYLFESVFTPTVNDCERGVRINSF